MACQEEIHIFCGTIINSTWTKPLEILENHVLGILKQKIVFLEHVSELSNLKNRHGFSDTKIIYLGPREFLMPGLIDTHIHAPQIVFAGLYNGTPLISWLLEHILPMQKACDLEHVQQRYKSVVHRTLKNGTTTAAYLCTENTDANLYLCRMAEQYGQRAVVALFTIDASDYTDWTFEQVVANLELFIQKALSYQSLIIYPAIYLGTAMSSSSEVLKKIRELQQKHDLLILSHIKECPSEFTASTESDVEQESPAIIFYKHGLLTNKIILGHGVYLNDDEAAMLKTHGSTVAHCPNSNISLRSGLCDARRLLNLGVNVALGTDVSGGYHPSMFDSIRYAVQTSNIVSFSKPPDYKRISFEEAFQLATLRGSKALGLEHKVGNFEVGKEFDALVIDTMAGENIDLFPEDDVMKMVEKFFFLGDDRNIKSVYVAGKKVL